MATAFLLLGECGVALCMHGVLSRFFGVWHCLCCDRVLQQLGCVSLCFCGWCQPVCCIGCVCWLHMLGDGRALPAL
jgi:hypothetical protein